MPSLFEKVWGYRAERGTAEKIFHEFLCLFKKREDEYVESKHIFIENLAQAIKSALDYSWYQKLEDNEKDVIRKLIAIKLYVEVSGDDIYNQVDMDKCREESPTSLVALNRFIEYSNSASYRKDKSEAGRKTLSFKDERKKNLEIPASFFEPANLRSYMSSSLTAQFVKELDPAPDRASNSYKNYSCWKNFCIELIQRVSPASRFLQAPESTANLAPKI